MIKPDLKHGIDCEGLDADFLRKQTQKSNLLLHAQLLSAQGQNEAAASNFAEAAEIEQHLSEVCEETGLLDKYFVHRFSAASCWAMAGNFFQAIHLCDELLARSDLTERFRKHVQEYADLLKSRRAEWYSEVLEKDSEPVSSEV